MPYLAPERLSFISSSHSFIKYLLTAHSMPCSVLNTYTCEQKRQKFLMS